MMRHPEGIMKRVEIKTREDALDFLIRFALQPKWINAEQRVQYAVYPVKKGIAVPITPQYKRKTEKLLTTALNLTCKRDVDAIRNIVRAKLKSQGRI